MRFLPSNYYYIDIRDSYNADVLTYATVSVLKKEHKHEVAKAVSAAISSPEEVLSAMKQNVPQKFTPNEAIALFIINGKQTKAQYNSMRSATLWKGKVV